ncbi:hypothetical protein BDW74DRAFT_171605 [Aspergillus multicolor]|uniref:aminoglycoside phosphotransferase family protein n=1 Tax=Aspergillus multicolor TaxID=41759 RepID=UPI003CCDE50A
MSGMINWKNIHLAERRGKFNTEALRIAAARSVEKCEAYVMSLSKLAEGGFNRDLQITMDDDTELLARLPYPSTGPKQFAVASEVATLALLRGHGPPVPRVYSYSTDAQNPIARLHTTPLPASGSIYHTSNIPSHSPRIVIPESSSCRTLLRIDRGPCADPTLKELAYLRAHGRPRFPFERAYREAMDYQLFDPTGHTASLETCLKIVPHLLPLNMDDLLRPVLRHPDLQLNNIFVSDDLDIVGLIDWQHASVQPLFLAAEIPRFFQNYDDPASLDFRPPSPPNLSGEPWEGNNISLRADLSTRPCPISFSPAEAESIMRLQGQQEEVDLQLKHVRNAIGIATDGWTTHQGYEDAVARARQMKVDGLASLETDYKRPDDQPALAVRRL